MAMTKAEKDALQAELARRQARDAETDAQKWFRMAISEEIDAKLEEKFGEPEPGEGEEGKGGKGGGLIDFGDFLGLGKKKTG